MAAALLGFHVDVPCHSLQMHSKDAVQSILGQAFSWNKECSEEDAQFCWSDIQDRKSAFITSGEYARPTRRPSAPMPA